VHFLVSGCEINDGKMWNVIFLCSFVHGKRGNYSPRYDDISGIEEEINIDKLASFTIRYPM